MGPRAYTDDVPDFTKPLSRFNAHHWAMMNGIAAHLSPAEWAVLCALYCHLPNVAPGKERIEKLSGVAKTSIKRARRRLKEVGLIDFDDDLKGGASRDEQTQYRVADIRQRSVADQIIGRLTGAVVAPVGHRLATGAMVDPVHDGPGTGAMVAPLRGQDGPGTGATMAPKVPKQRAQQRSQRSPVSGVTAAGLAPLATASPSAQPDPVAFGEPFKARGGHYDSPSPASSGAGQAAASPEVRRDEVPVAATAGPTSPLRLVSAAGDVVAASDPVGRSRQRESAAAAPAKKSKPTGLTDEQKQAACSSLEMMQRYVMFGVAGLDAAADLSTLPPARANPFKFQKSPNDEDVRLDQWTVNEFAGYFWLNVSNWRAANNVAQSLPDWGRLVKHIADLLATKTREQLLRHLRIVADWFIVIKFMNGGAGRSMHLNESALCHKLVESTVAELSHMDDAARQELWNKAINASNFGQNIDLSEAA